MSDRLKLRLALAILVVASVCLMRCDLWAQEPPMPKVQPKRWTMTRTADGYPIWHEHQSWRGYAAVYALLTLATIADVKSTFRGLDRCSTCREANPIMRPFVTRGRGATYAFTLGVNALTMEIARRRKRQHERWAIAPAIGIGIHGAAALSNSQVSR